MLGYKDYYSMAPVRCVLCKIFVGLEPLDITIEDYIKLKSHLSVCILSQVYCSVVPASIDAGLAQRKCYVFWHQVVIIPFYF